MIFPCIKGCNLLLFPHLTSLNSSQLGLQNSKSMSSAVMFLLDAERRHYFYLFIPLFQKVQFPAPTTHAKGGGSAILNANEVCIENGINNKNL